MISGWLTGGDEAWALTRAEVLQGEAEKLRALNRHGAARRGRMPGMDLNLHWQGQRGEIFAARVYGADAEPKVNVFHSHVPDIGRWGQVRTRSKPFYDLIVRPDDADDFYYILVIGTHVPHSQLRVVGGIWGADAKRTQWWRDPSGDGHAWFVPQEALTPPHRVPGGWV